ncbi:MAG: chemotaxis protein CheX [Desulfobacula sp.]|uniref:chemotaxis protein CheX n=1 Tax=Desulfobacula sp. TaxID=2593537 RepID=UPI0025BC9B46|nr:chemotaxis protein CheX [Desulfobacula sp.]MCD4720139.1 chemotaxis protein CheX [Desulfobacula sp.]
MMKILMTAMKTSISEVMETMFYLPVEFGEEATLAQCGMDKNKPIMASRLKFTGDVSGSLCIFIPKNLIGEMAENFMGEAKGLLTDDHLSGTLTEMLNMVCGNELSKIDTKVPFELSIPKVIDESKIQEKEILTIVETFESNMAILLKID